MATLDEIFAAMPDVPAGTHELLIIDPDTRQIYVPEIEAIFGVENDAKAERKYFRCPRIVGDGVDLSASVLRVIFKNANNQSDSYIVEDLTVDGDLAYFSWKLSRKVTRYKGDVHFIVGIYETDDPEAEPAWHTTLATGVSLEGMQADDSTVEEETSDVVAQLVAMMRNQTAAVEAEGAAQIGAVQAAAGAATSEAQAAIEEKGAATLASIPPDYTTMAKRTEQLHNEKADAYMVTTETAASHEIYAQNCVLQPIVQGETTQEGEGDPSPENVRPIAGVGYDGKIVLDGTEAWTFSPYPATGAYRALLVVDEYDPAISTDNEKSNVFSPHCVSEYWANILAGAENLSVGMTVSGGKKYLGFSAVSLGIITKDAWTAYLAEQAASGTPVTVYYKKTAHVDGEPYYIGVATEDAAGNYRAHAAEIGPAPLFTGDTVELYAKSGCDQNITIDGSQEFKNVANLGNVTRCAFNLPADCERYAGDSGFCLSEHLSCAVEYNGNYEHCYINRYSTYSAAFVFIANDKLQTPDAAGLAAYFAANPLQFWYRSTEYTEENDIPLCKVTRANRLQIMDGNEGWYAKEHSNGTKYAAATATGAYKVAACSHYLATDWSNVYGCAYTVNNNLVITDERFTDTQAACNVFAAQHEAGTPVTVVYQLTNPEIYAFEPAQLRSLHSLPETITASGQLSITYPQDTAHTIQQLVAAIRALGGTI